MTYRVTLWGGVIKWRYELSIIGMVVRGGWEEDSTVVMRHMLSIIYRVVSLHGAQYQSSNNMFIWYSGVVDRIQAAE